MDDRDFIQDLGLPFLAHRLRRASELIVEGTAAFLRTEGFAAPARSMSTLLLLKRNGALSITEIAYWLKLSHPLIIKLTKGLADAGYVKQQSDPKDNRRRMISLTAKGAQQADRVEEFTLTLADTFQDLFKDMGTDFFEAVERFEAAAADCSIEHRLLRAKAEKQSS
jgi:DNA-binding MarR family transcriptional regulator